jgi:penicillin-binding protein 1A
VKAARITVTFVLTVALGATALGTSVALLVPASHALLAATSPLPKIDVSLKAEPQRSYVLDDRGNLMTTLFDVDRAPVKLADVPKQLIEAVIAIEDRRFYEHNGVDWAGTFRALFRNVDAGTVEQGASTITEQLVKNTLTKGLKRDLKTKIREAGLAMRLEHELTKNQILEDYLNLVPFGNNAFGIEVAAERYFDESVAHLTLPQAALLAGLVQAPSALDPITHPAEAARRRREVLQAMIATHTITVRQETAANSAPLPTKVFYPQASQRSYYIDAVLNQLSNPNPFDPSDPANALGKTRAQIKQALYEGGLHIFTNYDPVMAVDANLAISNVIPQNQTQFTAALVAIDNTNGAVRAVAFGRGYDASQFDPAVDGPGRQAGSSFKGITLATALSSGYSPDDRVSGSPLSWRIGPGGGNDAFYTLSGDCHGGDPTLTEAIAISDNCAYVRTELSLGPGNYGRDGVRRVIAMASRMGIDTTNFQPVVSTTLGTNGVHPLEMAQAYSVIAADGVLHPAEFVSKIVGPTGKVLYQNNTAGTRVLAPEVARTETQMLTGVLTNGTAAGLSIGRPAAGKTGTTDANQDAWFIGYTPQITTAVWMGDPNAETPMTDVGGIAVFGATYPAHVWAAFMSAALTNVPVENFVPPDQSLWPAAEQIDEQGRGFRSYFYGPATTVPTTPTAPVTVTTRPRHTPPTTSPFGRPPTTVPRTTPRTTPPATTPTKPTGGP